MTIANRILLGFAFVTALMLGVGMYGLNQVGVVKETTETVVTRDMAMVREVAGVRNIANEMRAASDAVITSYLTRSAGGVGGSDTDPIAIWRQKGLDMDATLAAAIGKAREFRATAASAERAEAWGEIERHLSQTAASSRQGRADTEAPSPATT